MAFMGEFGRGTITINSMTSLGLNGSRHLMNAPPSLMSFVAPLMSLRWVSMKTGHVSLALGCCRLSVTLDVRKIIPLNTQLHSLNIGFGVILPFKQQEGCYYTDSSPLAAISGRKEKTLCLRRFRMQQVCQEIAFLHFFRITHLHQTLLLLSSSPRFFHGSPWVALRFFP